MTAKELYKETDYFKAFPNPGDVFSKNVEQHTELFLPLASLDLSAVNPEWSGIIHFISPIEPECDVVGDGGDEFFTYECRENWIGFQYDGNKCRFMTDFKYFWKPRLDGIDALTIDEKEVQQNIEAHYRDVKAGFKKAKSYFETHRVLHFGGNKDAYQPYLVGRLDGSHQDIDGNWAASEDFPLRWQEDEAEDVVEVWPQTSDGRDFRLVGTMSVNTYVFSENYALGCDLFLFWDPVDRIGLSTFDWS